MKVQIFAQVAHSRTDVSMSVSMDSVAVPTTGDRDRRLAWKGLSAPRSAALADDEFSLQLVVIKLPSRIRALRIIASHRTIRSGLQRFALRLSAI